MDLTAGDRFLLCSDGLCGYFEEDLGGLGVRLGNPDADAACKSLIDAANERGGKDNITSVIVTVGDVTSRDEMRAKRLQLKRDILARMPLFPPAQRSRDPARAAGHGRLRVQERRAHHQRG